MNGKQDTSNPSTPPSGGGGAVILKAENISKQYRLGTVGTGTLSHDLNRWWHKIRGKEDPYLRIGETNDRTTKGASDYVWALQDINFEVQRGEVLGIIGKNGAGKSTLLKILSKVTAPTTGSIKSRGRIASLLEVGTGFNGELTGRENVYLNGAILGMTKKEITQKLDEIIAFAKDKLNFELPENFSKYALEHKISHLKNLLDRPIRICGMVKNEGEPGGGPFWVQDSKGNTSLQIVETSQVDLENHNQVKILSSATHFNPVDLVCALKDHNGKKYHLPDFVDKNTGFISLKSKDGRELKALELPGLWNGAMSDWNTVFVEVPIETFNPVKTVNDLLRPEHQ